VKWHGFSRTQKPTIIVILRKNRLALRESLPTKSLP
jgi:hypothetical protein